MIVDQYASLLDSALGQHRAGQLAEAVRLYRAFLKSSPGRFDVHVNLGAALASLGNFPEAMLEYAQALALRPDSPELHNNMGAALERLGQPDRAAESYRRAVELRPDFAEAHYNLGVMLMRGEALEAAASHYRRAVEINPAYVDAIFNLGNVELSRGNCGDAIAQYRKVLALDPDFIRAEYNLGTALCRSNLVKEGFAAWTRCATRMHGITRRPPAADAPAEIHDHDRLQRLHLAQAAPGAAAPLRRLVGGDRVRGPALGRLDFAALSQGWRSAQPRFLVVDDALSDAALAGLREFCLASAVWQTAHRGGYLIATPEDGVASPLMAQVAEELRAGLPDIIGEHPLGYVAAFKYRSDRDGSDIHSDGAAVNINFWITPDEANLDPQSGGLVIWDVAPPPGERERYNADADEARAFLARQGARSAVVPHRANRMMIFESALFHKTDRFEFKQGYADRRINITMLFGQR